MTELLPPPPRAVLEIAARLEEAGFETWCVGGAVRDALLGHEHLDWDLATAARPEDVRRLFRRTVPIGVEFGTVGVLDREGRMHEVTTFRRDVETDGRHAVVRFGVSLEEDLARRDFTINAIAYSPSRRELRDPHGGRGDLQRKILRAVGEPAQRMAEDRLRALRALRFAARFELEMDPETWRAVAESAPYLNRLSRERVKQELEKTMEQVPRPSLALRLWLESGAMRALVPSLAGLTTEALAALDCLPPPALSGRPQRRINRFTALFLDVGALEATKVLKALRFSNADTDWISGQVERWDGTGRAIGESLRAEPRPTDAEIRRWVAAIGRTRTAPLLRVAHARWCAERGAGKPAPDAAAVTSLYRRAVRSAYRDAIELSDLALDGDDLLAAGIPPGPALGKILKKLLNAVIEDPSLDTRERLLALALELQRIET